MSSQPRAGWSRRVAFGLVSIAVGLGLAELTLRIAGLPPGFSLEVLERYMRPDAEGPQTFAHDPERLWRLAPEARGMVVNRVGTRGWWPSRPAAPDDLRIVCVGDSCTLAKDLRHEDVYGVRLGRRLQEALPNRRVEVALAGVPGYSTFQSRVLFEREVLPLAPDLVVFYVGVWNDFAPAVEQRDSEWARWASGSGWDSLRLVRLWNRLGAGAPSVDEHLEAARGGRPISGVRVPLAEYREHLVAMFEGARRAGSEVLIVRPPLAAGVEADAPWAVPYREALVEVAEAGGHEWVDAHALLGAAEAGHPEPWRSGPGGGSLCFLDRVHPTRHGHRLIADALFERVRDRFAGGGRDSGAETFEVASAELSALSGSTIGVRGEGLGDRVIRAWIGATWCPSVTRIDEDELELIAPLTRPGPAWLWLDTGEAVIRSDRPVSVRALPMAVDVRDGEEIAVDVRLPAPAGWRVALWLAVDRRDSPVDTGFGEFWLVTPAGGRAPGFADTPFRFDLIGSPVFAGVGDESGQAHLTVDIGELRLPRPVTVWLQALVVHPTHSEYGVLTEAASVDLR